MKTKLSVIFISFIIAFCSCSHNRINSSPPIQNNLDALTESLSYEIISFTNTNNSTKIAITDFLTINGNNSELGSYLSEKIAYFLFKSNNNFEIVERKRIKDLHQEILLSLNGFIEDSSAQEIGKATGADVISFGYITDLGRTLDITLRLVDTETGNVIATANKAMQKTKHLENMMIGNYSHSTQINKFVPANISNNDLIGEWKGFIDNGESISMVFLNKNVLKVFSNKTYNIGKQQVYKWKIDVTKKPLKLKIISPESTDKSIYILNFLSKNDILLTKKRKYNNSISTFDFESIRLKQVDSVVSK